MKKKLILAALLASFGAAQAHANLQNNKPYKWCVTFPKLMCR